MPRVGTKLLLFNILMGYVSRKTPVGKGEKLLYSDNLAIRESSKENLEEIIMKMSMTKTEVVWVIKGATV